MSATLDAKGLKCPLPVMKTRKALKGVPVGACLTVLATDPVSSIDVRHFCNVEGHDLVDWSEAGGVFTYVIRRSR
jgi:tRNA 2-thiouridine synthesizing protein A